MADWTVVWAAAVGAGGVLTGTALTMAAERHRDRVSYQRDVRAERRDAYLALFTKLDSVRALVQGSASLGGPVDVASKPLSRELTDASVAAEFHASPRAWADIKPLVETIALMANWTSLKAHGVHGGAGFSTDAIRDRLHELGADTDGGFQQLWSNALEAARRDLLSA